MKINHSTIHPCIHPFIDRSRRAIDRVGRSPIGRPGIEWVWAWMRMRERDRDRNANATANGADDEACVRRGLGDGRVRDDRVRRWSSVGRADDASSSSSESSSESFVRALDVETLRDDVIARSRDPWVISFSGSRRGVGCAGRWTTRSRSRAIGETVGHTVKPAAWTTENVDVRRWDERWG